MEVDSDPNFGADELEGSPNLKVDDDDGAGAAPNEKPPVGLGGTLLPKVVPEVSLCGCEPNVDGAGAEPPKVKAGVGTCVTLLVVPPKVGAEEASSLFTILPSGTNPFDSVDEADGAMKLKVVAVVASALVRGAGVPPKLKPVPGFVAVTSLFPNEKTGLFPDSACTSDLLLSCTGKVRLAPFAGGAVFSED